MSGAVSSIIRGTTIEAKLWEGESFLSNVKTFDCKKYSRLMAGIGVEFSMRRRSKFVGSNAKLENNEDVMNSEQW